VDDDLLPKTRNVLARPAPEADPGQTARVDVAPRGQPGQPAAAALPVVGEFLENCRLVAELGTGASGRAFLARQGALADRPIVLKVYADASRDEHLTLARLQHTNIMPLYWASALPARGLHVLAMPYLARTTLSGLLDRLAGFPRETWSGRRVFDLLEDDQAALPLRIAVQEQPAQMLKASSWADFIVRTVQTLAQALAFAHKRDILHLDLKPDNILITPDGQPILLDLDIARPPIPAGSTAVPWLGGTPEFMSPEQHAAVDALDDRRPIPTAVDGRSDLYSIGVVLYHALGGEANAARRPAPLGLPRVNPHVSRGLADILARCLAEAPAARYPDCAAFAEDLRRHLDDLPLAGVRNRWPDRWRKWRRRRPFSLLLILLMAGFGVAASAAGFNFHRRNEDRRLQAEAALLGGQEAQRNGQYEAAIRQFLAGQELAEHTYGGDHLQAELSRRLTQAHRLQRAGELKKVVGLLHLYALQDHTPLRLQWVLEAAGRKLWADRRLLTDRAGGRLEQAVETDIREQLQELALLWTDLCVRIAPPAHEESARREARHALTDAELMFGPSPGLRLASGLNGAVSDPPMPPRAVWEFCALGRAALAEGDHAEAARFMQAALDLDPLGFVPNFHFGVCALRQKKYDLAARAFSFCAGQDPRPECFLLRGEALAALGERDRALADFNYALAKNPEMGNAYQCRGNLYRDMGRQEDAEMDFQSARRLSD